MSIFFQDTNESSERAELLTQLALHVKMFCIYPQAKIRRKLVLSRFVLQIDADSLHALQDLNRRAELEHVLSLNRLSQKGTDAAKLFIQQLDVVLEVSQYLINFEVAVWWLQKNDPILLHHLEKMRTVVDHGELLHTLVDMPRIKHEDQLWLDELREEYLQYKT